MRHLSLVGAILVSCAAAAAFWYWFDRPVPVPESWSRPFASVSFAPFRRYQNPLTENFATPEQIRTDLASLVGVARGVRTYSTLQNLEYVPKFAKELGLKVTMGAWLSSEKNPKDAVKNGLEIQTLIRLANEYPDTITRVIVGNEVLLRRDLTAEQLIAYIRQVKAAIKQPVSYADVWAFYLKNPEVVREVDFLTIHILPFWEDEPVALDRLEEYMVPLVERMRAAFPGKPILIGESGWPSMGRDRGPAVVNTVNEARFIRRLADIASRHNFDYNVVEAFDQPWKAELENTVGAYWGLLDSERHPKFAMSGPVTEVDDWILRAIIAIATGALAAFYFGRRLNGTGERMTLALMAQICGWLVITTAFHTVAVSFQWWHFLWEPLRAGLPAFFALALLDRAALFLGAQPQADDGEDVWHGEIMAFWFAFYAIVWTFLLAVDGRYRDIPEFDFALPCGGLALLLLLRAVQSLRGGGKLLPALGFEGLLGQGESDFTRRMRSRLMGWLGWGLIASAALALIGEGFAVIGEDFTRDHPTLGSQLPLILKGMIWNREILGWALMQLAMSAPFVAGWFLARKISPTPAES